MQYVLQNSKQIFSNMELTLWKKTIDVDGVTFITLNWVLKLSLLNAIYILEQYWNLAICVTFSENISHTTRKRVSSVSLSPSSKSVTIFITLLFYCLFFFCFQNSFCDLNDLTLSEKAILEFWVASRKKFISINTWSKYLFFNQHRSV